MKLSFDEQKTMGVKRPEESRLPPNRVSRLLTRRVSPYVTWLLLRIGVSANACTSLRVLITLCVGLLVTNFDSIYWIVAVPLGYVAIVLDAVDGELARTTGTAAPQGAYLEMMTSHFAQPFVLACGAIGLFRGLGGLHVIVVGLGAALGAALVVAHAPAVKSAAWESGVVRRPKVPSHRDKGWLKAARMLANVALITPGLVYLPQLLVTSVFDSFVSPFLLFGLPVNARLLWLALFALGAFGATLVRVIQTVRRGIGIWL